MKSAGRDRFDGLVGGGYAASFEPAMRLAIGVARSRPDQTEVPVGAVVLTAAGQVTGEGHNARASGPDPTAHAEIVALRDAAGRLGTWRLDGCTLVVTLEPCTMCAGALLAARIGRLVYGATDPGAGAAGSLWDVVRDRRLGPPVEVIPGVLADQCASMLSGFFGDLRRNR